MKPSLRITARMATNRLEAAESLSKICPSSHTQDVAGIDTVAMHAQRDYTAHRRSILETQCRLNPVQLGHRDIHDHDIGC